MFGWDENNQQLVGMDRFAYVAFMVGIVLASIVPLGFHFPILAHILSAIIAGPFIAGIIILLVHHVAVWLLVRGRLDNN